MLIELEDLEIHPVDFREEFSPARAGRIWSRSITASIRWCRTSG